MNKCKRMTVLAVGLDSYGNMAWATNGNNAECTGIPGGCGCTHAEILLLRQMPHPVTVSVSHSPCLACARALVEAGVQKVIYIERYRLLDGLIFLRDHDVDIEEAGR